MDPRYAERRARIEETFRRATLTSRRAEPHISPSGAYQLEITTHATGPNTWAYSRGVVTRLRDGKQLADVKRNYSAFWHAWVAHPNGKEYLLCGEDYQGYSTLNLTDERYHVHFPEEGYRGVGFCWAAVYPSPDGLMLAVDGCYWACPYDLVFYDFRTPDELPYRELARHADLWECEGWKGDTTFALARDVDVRASDGKEYASLSDAERDELDADSSLITSRRERVEVPRPAADVP